MGRCFIIDCIIGAMHYGVFIDHIQDNTYMNYVRFHPVWDYAYGIAYPSAMDTYMTGVGTIGILAHAAGRVVITNCGILGLQTFGMQMNDSSAHAGSRSAGYAANIEFNGPATGISCISTSDLVSLGGWQIVNFNLNSSLVNVSLPAGGGNAPQLLMSQGVLRGSPILGYYAVSAGFLDLDRVWQGDLPWRSLSAPAMPLSAVSVANPYPYDVQVNINGGTVTNVAISGVSTGGPRGTLTLGSGQTISITYSSVPSWTWFTP